MLKTAIRRQAMASSRGETLVYVGTYTRMGKSEGIYVYRFDPETGALDYRSKATGIHDPSFLDIHPTGKWLYSVCRPGAAEFGGNGAVSAFAIDPETGELAFLNRASCQGPGPCHLTVDKTGRLVLVANYGGGSVAALPILADGRVGEATDFVQHQGSSVNPDRQEGPHAHSVTIDPGNRYAFVADLGLDKILIYKLDLERGKLIPNDPPCAQTAPGAGPRHFDVHPSRKQAYVINELDNTVTVFAYEEATGSLRPIQALSTLPDGFKESSYCADIHVARSGWFVYGSNRGHDSIAIFAVEEGTERLKPVGYESTQGRTPRNFALDLTSRFLLAANQDTDNIVVFRIDQKTGKLTPTGHGAEVPNPVCLKLKLLS
jgi:6-phosphogluconolactonase